VLKSWDTYCVELNNLRNENERQQAIWPDCSYALFLKHKAGALLFHIRRRASGVLQELYMANVTGSKNTQSQGQGKKQ
jgi:hypothetical protein